MKYFNVTGLCLPGRDYMCDISSKVSQIVAMVERGSYFTINRARQYGKTTVIRQLEKVLLEKGYRTWINKSVSTFEKLDIHLNKVCKNKKIVLFIDETDKTSNNLVFLRFIGMLRDKYLERGSPNKATFQSIILAGVYDIKNIKFSPPWNIATDFNVDMSFNETEIASMLAEYENDHKTGMDIGAISKEIRAYTSGYPYLVSRICQNIDEDLDRNWTINGVQKAVRMILIEQSTLFDDLFKNVKSNSELRDLLFITFLRPFINGVGFYHLESETRDGERTDVIVELKLWYGEASHEKALEQLVGYLDSKNKDTGYLLTFDFRKENNIGKPQAKWVEHKGKRIFDCMAGV